MASDVQRRQDVLDGPGGLASANGSDQGRAMRYACLMVHLEIGRPNASVLQVAATLAARHQAAVVGMAVGRQLAPVYPDGYADGDLFAQDLEDIERHIGVAAAEFRNALQAAGTVLEWRASVQMGAQAARVVHELRSADLLITRASSPDLLGTTRMADCADLVVRAGRPVLVVPDALIDPRLDRIVVGWKDTREARRAVADALPLLRQAAHVTVVELARPDALHAAQRRVADVCAWLVRHGITAEAVAQPAGEDDNLLNAFAEQRGADLIVAGAYGHSRLGEWIFGGATRDLMQRSSRCVLFSH